ncbi:unnamed protein product [Rhizophagus irregularis]|nr:unnamed protein product [Rhizophagus irregularis]CAB5366687.1 unnamed protein product [Rhizophagus irregularis]
MKLWLLQGNIYQGKHSPPGPGTDVSDFSKVIGSTVAAKAWNRHEQLLVVKQLITSPPRSGTDMKLWLLQSNIYQGKHSPPGPGTDVSDFSKVIGSTVAAKAWNRHEQLFPPKYYEI